MQLAFGKNRNQNRDTTHIQKLLQPKSDKNFHFDFQYFFLNL